MKGGGGLLPFEAQTVPNVSDRQAVPAQHKFLWATKNEKERLTNGMPKDLYPCKLLSPPRSNTSYI